jgi:hypothetical protein
MAIYRLLREASFGPEETAAMSEAYETALKTLGVVDRNDPITSEIAAQIILVARSGVREAAIICEQAIAGLTAPGDRLSIS